VTNGLRGSIPLLGTMYILVDVEATGISPFSGVMTEFGAVEFKSRASFHGVLHEAIPDPENPAKPKLVNEHWSNAEQYFNDLKVMKNFYSWVTRFNDRPIFVSDNNGYDSQWINYYFDKTLGKNPFGHSSRRISDFWAGLQNDFSNTQKWKQFRLTEHDHNPVNDAMGNAEALAVILDAAEQRRNIMQ
jgi:DNA polymerase III epsilon subunit-like protein